MTESTPQERRRAARRRNATTRLPLILGAAGLLLILAAVWIVLSERGAAGDPDAITLLDGGSVHIEDYAGQALLVNFWATWCPPCKQELPELEAYYQAHQDDGFTMLVISAGESAATVREFIESEGYSFPVGLDPHSRLSQEYGVNGIPTLIVIDAEGEIAYRHVGVISREDMEAEITPLLIGAAGG